MESHPQNAVPVTNSGVALQRLGGNTGLYGTLLTYFLQDAPGLMQRLREVHQAGARDLFVQTIHGLKGLAATFEAIPFVVVAREIETAARAGNATIVQTLLPQLEVEFDRLFKEIELLAHRPSTSDSAVSEQG